MTDLNTFVAEPCRSDCFGILPDGEACHYHRTPTCGETWQRVDALIRAGQALVAKGYPILDGSKELEYWREISRTEKGSSEPLGEGII